MQKDEFRIGEISDAFGLSADTVRYYNRLGIVAPLRREDNNYRFFDLNAVSNLHSVTLLRSFGIPIETIQARFGAFDLPLFASELLETQKTILQEIEQLYRRQSELLRFYTLLSQVGTSVNRTVIRQSPQWWIAYENQELDIAQLVKGFNALMTRQERMPSYAFILPKESFLAHTRSYSHYSLLLDGPCENLSGSTRTIPPGKCAYYVYWGHQRELQNAYDDIYVWIASHNYQVAGDIVERFIISGPQESLMELWVPIQ